MARTLQDKLLDALSARDTWAQRQGIWYEMLHDGLRRRNKPFKNASDLHLPIARNAVTKLAPYYINSTFGRQRLASFTPLQEQLGDASEGAAQFLDWKLRKESNYPLETGYLVHMMLACGNPVMKLRWDPKLRGGRGGVVFRATDPLFFIVPKSGDEIDEMDYFADVIQTTVGKYVRDPRYKAKNSEFIARIKGGDKQVEQWKDKEKQASEGITYSRDEDEIILFESYERVKEGWRVKTYSPSAPEELVRAPFILPMRWQGEPIQPFVRYRCEITEKGFYASRGVVETVAPFETYGTKMWNQQADWLEYSAKPLFVRDPQAAIQNTGNPTMRPGDVLPPGITPATMPQPPFELKDQIMQARQLAEETAGTPDFGVTGDENSKGGDSRTATEWNYLGSFASQGIQYKAWVNSIAEGETYKKAWALYVQFGKEDLTYFQSNTRKVLPAQALHDNYLIEPDSVPDAWNKQQRMQRSVARYQMFKGHPNIQQGPLAKSVLEDDDPRLIKTLYIDDGQKAANEAEDEAQEISILMEGYPAQAMPGENHPLRLNMLFGKLQQLSMMPPPASPAEMQKAIIGRQAMQQHIVQHLMLLKQENPALARQFTQAIQVMDPNGTSPQPSPQGGEGAGISVPGGTVERIGGAGLIGSSAGRPGLAPPNGAAMPGGTMEMAV